MTNNLRPRIAQRLLRVPAIKYDQAWQLKRELATKQGVNLPLWACYVEVEKKQQGPPVKDPFERFRGFGL